MFRINYCVAMLAGLLMLSAMGIAEGEAIPNEVLLSRIERLENELNQLKQMVQTDRPVAAPPVAGELTLSESDKERILYLLENDKAGRKNVWSSLDIGVYGYIKLDGSYDTSRTSTGNFARWVNLRDADGDSQFNMTANQTRLGLNITGPQVGSMHTRGNVEVDFYGDGGQENRSKLLVRHAYMTLDWPEEKFSILAGQTWDVISPLNPGTLNYSVLWWSGNIGNRRPQIRLTKGFDLDGGAELTLAGAVARTIGRQNPLNPSYETGADAGYPSLQGRVGLDIPFFEAGRTALGVSGHWGSEEYDLDATGRNKKFKSWSLNFDFVQPVAKWLDVRGEMFTGKNLSTYAGGIGQGVTIDIPQNIYDEVGSRGGWVAARLTPIDKWCFNLGGGLESVNNSDIADGDRKFNRTLFANGIYSINKNTSVGLELSHMRTEYRGGGDAENLRAQMSFMYSF